MADAQGSLLTYLLLQTRDTAANAALAYAWCKVCFVAWDETLDMAGEKILGYSRWPEPLRLLLHALYPAYFVYSSTRRISGPDGPRKKRDIKQWITLLTAACVAVAVLGLKQGRAQRLITNRARAKAGSQ